MPRSAAVIAYALVACVLLLSGNADATNKMSMKKHHEKNPKKTPSPKKSPSPKPSPSPSPTYATIAAAAAAYNLTTLVSVISMTPLLSAVTNGATKVTVFAPTNAVSDR